MSFVSITVSSYNGKAHNRQTWNVMQKIIKLHRPWLITNYCVYLSKIKLTSLIERKHNNCRRNPLNSLGASTVDCLSLDGTLLQLARIFLTWFNNQNLAHKFINQLLGIYANFRLLNWLYTQEKVSCFHVRTVTYRENSNAVEPLLSGHRLLRGQSSKSLNNCRKELEIKLLLSGPLLVIPIKYCYYLY